MSRRIIKGVLHNFLATFTSRYSDYDGYWLFGKLVGEMEELRIDLLSSKRDAVGGVAAVTAIQLAAKKFREQMDKAGFIISRVREAHLDITKLPESKNGIVNGCVCAGYTVRFVVRVVLDDGKTCKSERSVFAAPHDSQVERRSSRAS